MSQQQSAQPVTANLLQELLEQDIISHTTYTTACQHLQKPQWHKWLEQMLLFIGLSLIIAGIIFFFAYNWAEMLPRYKFAVIETAILLLAGLSWFFTVKTLAGKGCISSCVVLIGVLMAVFGQTYQTGADSYELFLGWSLLSLGLVIYGRFTPLWLIWITTASTGIILYWIQVAEPVYHSSLESCWLALALLHTMALVGYEAGFRKKWDWLEVRWLPPLLLSAIFIALTLPVFHLILDFSDTPGITKGATLLWLLAIIATYSWYRFKQPDFIALFLMATSICIVVIVLVCKLISEFLFTSSMDEGVLLLSGLVILGSVGTTTVWLKKLHLALSTEGQA